MKTLRTTLLLGAALLVGSAVGCGGGGDSDDGGGGDRSCPTLCNEAQLGSCTSIHGDCDAFCGALDSAAPRAACTAARDSYQSCLSDGANACDKSCNATEKALEDCMSKYCIAHSNDADCKTLVASF